MTTWFERLRNNPKTTVFGIAKIVGGLWFIIQHPGSITLANLTQPETFLPLGVIVSGVESLFSADAKDEIKAKDVKPDTTVVGEK